MAVNRSLRQTYKFFIHIHSLPSRHLLDRLYFPVSSTVKWNHVLVFLQTECVNRRNISLYLARPVREHGCHFHMLFPECNNQNLNHKPKAGWSSKKNGRNLELWITTQKRLPADLKHLSWTGM